MRKARLILKMKCTLSFFCSCVTDSSFCSLHTYLVWFLTSFLTFINFMLLCSFRSAPFFITPHLSLSLPPTRALYDRVGEAEGDLSFKKDDILYVDESLPKGIFGTWMAWQLDENAQQIQRGQIPSKYMWVETANTQYISIITIHKQFVHHHSYLHCCRHIYSWCEYNIDSFPFFNNNKNLKKK